MQTFVLKLYVAGPDGRSHRAAVNLRRICAEELGGGFEVRVIDVLDQPHLAEEARVFATPTVVKDWPLPARRVIGDLSDAARVLQGLDLQDWAGAADAPAGE